MPPFLIACGHKWGRIQRGDRLESTSATGRSNSPLAPPGPFSTLLCVKRWERMTFTEVHQWASRTSGFSWICRRLDSRGRVFITHHPLCWADVAVTWSLSKVQLLSSLAILLALPQPHPLSCLHLKKFCIHSTPVPSSLGWSPRFWKPWCILPTLECFPWSCPHPC